MAVDLPNAFTVLTLTGIGVAPYSARGISMTIAPIEQSRQVKRNINGGLINAGLTQFRKYRATISCTDKMAPAFGGLWPGQLVTVECVAEVGNMTLTTDRTLLDSYVEDGVTYGRMVLSMMVTAFEWGKAEYDCTAPWSLEAEEV